MSKRNVLRWMMVTLVSTTLLLSAGPAVHASPPANDNFDDATEVVTLPFSDAADITDATNEFNEPLVGHLAWPLP
jgi:hypothetical protein